MSLSLTDFQNYLQKIKIPLRLSCRTESGWPMILSLWFMVQEEKIWCATPESARVIRYLENEPRCAFEIAGDLPPYCGIRGQARATLDPSRGDEVLEQLLKRYQGSLDTPLAKKLLSQKDTEIAIILEPVNLFHWDFSKRMTPQQPADLNLGICP